MESSSGTGAANTSPTGRQEPNSANDIQLEVGARGPDKVALDGLGEQFVGCVATAGIHRATDAGGREMHLERDIAFEDLPPVRQWVEGRSSLDHQLIAS